MIGVALFGAGRIAGVHARSVADAGARLVTIYDIRDDAAGELAGAYGAQVASTQEAAIGHPDIECVIIAASSDAHVELCLQAVEAGKWVMCEKPLAPSLSEAHACVEKLGSRTDQVFLAFNRRFDPGHRRVKAAIASGEIGNLEQLIITSRDPYPPPLDYIPGSGGLFRDMTVHDFDMARWLLGEEPVRLFAQGACIIDEKIGELGDIDSGIVTLTTESGKQAVIVNSRRASYGYDQRIEAFGSTGMVLSDNQPIDGVKRFGADEFGAPGPFPEFFLERYRTSYRSEVEQFLACASKQEKVPVTALDGWHAAYLSEAACVSLETGRPVDLRADCEVTWA